MKHSIRVKFTMLFIGLMAAVLGSMWAVNSFFLESFYTKQKLQLLENAYENLNAIAVDKEFLGENITEDLQSLYSNDGEQTEASRLLRLMNDKYNTTIVIQDSITGELIPGKGRKIPGRCSPPLYIRNHRPQDGDPDIPGRPSGAEDI